MKVSPDNRLDRFYQVVHYDLFLPVLLGYPEVQPVLEDNLDKRPGREKSSFT